VLIIPAIDLLDGRAVRLRQGNYRQPTDFGDPIELACRFAAQGAQRLHLVDLDGAREGEWRNLETIARIAAAVSLPVQAGGGARHPAQVESALRRGVDRVVVGTAAASSADPAGWVRRFGDRLAFSLDSRRGQIVTEGWRRRAPVGLLELARRLRDAGAPCFIHTEVSRDGMLSGVDLTGLRLLRPLGVPVLVAGGITTYDDLKRAREAGAEGAIIGRALLSQRIDLARALEAVGGHQAPRQMDGVPNRTSLNSTYLEN
jgi:phosphoribosylformimino-5-aminoimidazole carboxamide ribotide isomerase